MILKQTNESMIETTIIIPTYNERKNLKIFIDQIFDVLGNNNHYEIIIVDDNSPDGTGKIADELRDRNENIIVIHRPTKMGISSAIIDGVKRSNGDYILISDGDLQHSAAFYKTLLNEAKNGYDLIIASRYAKDAKIEGWILTRKIISLGATLIAHLFFPETRKVKDPLSGYFVFKKNKIDNVRLSGIGWKFLLELLIMVNFKRIKEISYSFKTRINGESKMGALEYWNYLKLIFNLKKLKIKLKK